MKIKRTKTGPPGPDGLPPAAATHYAAAVSAHGVVTSWVPGEQDAGHFDAVAVEGVLVHYATRPLAGTVEAVGETDGAPTASEVEDRLRDAVAEIARQRDVIAFQLAEIEALRRDLDAATAPPANAWPPLELTGGEVVENLVLDAPDPDEIREVIGVRGLRYKDAEAPAETPPEHPPAPEPTPRTEPKHARPRGRPKTEES